MATPILLTSGNSATDGTDYVTASVAPSANSLITISVCVATAATHTGMALLAEGCGLEWVEVARREHSDFGGGAWAGQTTLFRAMGPAPEEGAITITVPQTAVSIAWSVIEFPEVDTSGTNGSGAVVQVVENFAQASSAELTATLDTFKRSDNITFALFGASDGAGIPRTWTAGAGFTEAHDTGAQFSSVMTEYKLAADTTANATPSASTNMSVIAIEIAKPPQDIVRIGFNAPVIANNANLTLTEPPGTAEGHYHLVWISHRSAIGYDTPAGWEKLLDASGGNTSTTASTGIGSGELFGIARGVSAPALTFVKQAGTGDVASGRIITYRGVDPANPISYSSIDTAAVQQTTVFANRVLDALAGQMLFVGIAGGADTTFSGWQLSGEPIFEFANDLNCSELRCTESLVSGNTRWTATDASPSLSWPFTTANATAYTAEATLVARSRAANLFLYAGSDAHSSALGNGMFSNPAGVGTGIRKDANFTSNDTSSHISLAGGSGHLSGDTADFTDGIVYLQSEVIAINEFADDLDITGADTTNAVADYFFTTNANSRSVRAIAVDSSMHVLAVAILNPAPLGTDVAIRNTAVPTSSKKGKRNKAFAHLSYGFTNWQMPSNVEPIFHGWATSVFEVPPSGPPPLPKGYMGWMNRDNEVASSSYSFDLPPRAKDRHSYAGYQWHTVEAPNFEIAPGSATFAVPPGATSDDYYSSFLQRPLSAPSVESAALTATDMPHALDRNSYVGHQNPAVGEDANEWLEKSFALPVLGRDRNTYAGWLDSVTNRDESGELVEYRHAAEHSAMPPWALDRHRYDGYQAAPAVQDQKEDPVEGFRFFDMPPVGFDTRDYTGAQNRIDFEDLRETPVGGFMFADLPPTGSNSFVSVIDYTGASSMPLPPDTIADVGNIWKPTYRARRR